MLLCLVSVAPAKSQIVKTAMLDNGMEIVVIEDHRAPIIVHMVFYKVGSADEEEGKTGLAHYLEHLMFRGTKTFSQRDFEEHIANAGGWNNGFTSYDVTAYFQTTPSHMLPLLMEIEADRMVNLDLNDKKIVEERNIVLEERFRSLDNHPIRLLQEKISKALNAPHPYKTSIIGWEKDIRNLTAEDAISFYKTHYAPNNAVLVVGGDTTLEKVVSLAEKFYGVIPKSDYVRKARPEFGPLDGSKIIHMKDERATQALWARDYRLPQITMQDDETTSNESLRKEHIKEYAALDIGLSVLADSWGSWLYKKLADELSLIDNVYQYRVSDVKDAGHISIFIYPKTSKDFDRVANIVDEEIERLKNEPITQAELDRKRISFLASFIYGKDDIVGLARMYGWQYALGGKKEDFLMLETALEEITQQDVQNAAKKFLIKTQSVTGHLTPKQTKTTASIPDGQHKQERLEH